MIERFSDCLPKRSAFELSSLGFGLIAFGLQLDVAFNSIGVPALRVPHFATKFRALTSQITDVLLQRTDSRRQKLKLLRN